MAQELPAPQATVPAETTGAAVGGAGKIQFSIAHLLLAMLVVGASCAAIRWLGSVWLAPFVLAGFSTGNVVLAVLRGSTGRMLKLGHWHLALGFAWAAVASALAVWCLEYGAVGGTDKSAGQIVQISLAVLGGPLVGPVANPASGAAVAAWKWAVILLVPLLLATAPFVVVRRIVPTAVAVLCWILFAAAMALWFVAAIVSLGYFLS